MPGTMCPRFFHAVNSKGELKPKHYDFLQS
jgi:hypothetical protein